jgi:hypothetical protein
LRRVLETEERSEAEPDNAVGIRNLNVPQMVEFEIPSVLTGKYFWQFALEYIPARTPKGQAQTAARVARWRTSEDDRGQGELPWAVPVQQYLGDSILVWRPWGIGQDSSGNFA